MERMIFKIIYDYSIKPLAARCPGPILGKGRGVVLCCKNLGNPFRRKMFKSCLHRYMISAERPNFFRTFPHHHFVGKRKMRTFATTKQEPYTPTIALKANLCNI